MPDSPQPHKGGHPLPAEERAFRIRVARQSHTLAEQARIVGISKSAWCQWLKKMRAAKVRGLPRRNRSASALARLGGRARAEQMTWQEQRALAMSGARACHEPRKWWRGATSSEPDPSCWDVLPMGVGRPS